MLFQQERRIIVRGKRRAPVRGFGMAQLFIDLIWIKSAKTAAA
jgi:hypothetical protein